MVCRGGDGWISVAERGLKKREEVGVEGGR